MMSKSGISMFDWAWPYFSGLLLGLGMILPIGPQNIFILTQSIAGGPLRGLTAAVTAGFCDSTLIIIGAAGLSQVLAKLPWLEKGLLWAGFIFLLYLGLSALRREEVGQFASRNSNWQELSPTAASRSWVFAVIIKGIGVSWGNPHAILDTVGILGAAIAAYPPQSRSIFATGTVTASWLFFFVLVLIGSWLRRKVSPQTAVWISRFSGAIMLFFALLLGYEAVK